MTAVALWARCLPIALLAIFGGTALIVCNPGYFWDDWVWIFHDAAENIQIGKELGIWWGGYATTFINSLPSPALAMRATAFVAWVASAVAIALTLHRRMRMSGMESFQFFLIYCATHVALIRFLTSVALYNVYIAAFWIGAALLLVGPRSWKTRPIALLLLFFSFYLNSLIVLYALVVVLMALEHVGNRVGTLLASTSAPGGWRLSRFQATFRALIAQSSQPLREFARNNWALLALPVVFLVIKRLTTVQSLLYGNYNAIHGNLAFSAIGQSFATIRPVLRDFFATAAQSVHPIALVLSALVCFGLLRLLPRPTHRHSLQAIFVQLALGLVFFAAAVYPYIIVDKAPELRSFYDARNAMPAIAGLDVILLALINLLDRGFAYIPVLRRFGRDLLVGYVIGASLCASVATGIGLWRDWFRQTATIDYLRVHRDEIRNDKTFVFDDKSTSTRFDNRMIWNYEYTGNLIRAFGGRDHLGISVNEYAKWPPKVGLLINPVVRRRFNIRDYDFKQPHAIVTVRNGFVSLSPARTLMIVYAYLNGEDWRAQLDNYFSFDLAQEFTEADQRVTEMFDIASALAAYHLEHGHYPTRAGMADGTLPAHAIYSTGIVGVEPIVGDIPGLFPAYMPRPDTMRVRYGMANYMYFSDGVDFKLVYAGAVDLPYAAQSHPALFDAKNAGYGVWTWDARNW